jgi:RNA polymerase sigma factor (sigma-70 family)
MDWVGFAPVALSRVQADRDGLASRARRGSSPGTAAPTFSLREEGKRKESRCAPIRSRDSLTIQIERRRELAEFAKNVDRPRGRATLSGNDARQEGRRTVSNRTGLAQPLRMLFHVGTVAGLTDAELLERFASRGREESELAFTALVERHGAMVHGVIRRVLSNPHDAQDAFQATFLVLLRRAHSIRKRNSLVSWLHGVALRVAWASRLVTARHRKQVIRKAAGARSFIDEREYVDDGDEIGPIIHEELSRLPERYRAPLIHCYLEGLTHEQAAARLRWPLGTVKSRLSRGRDRLRDRLLRRGVAPSVSVISVLSFRNAADGALPAALVERVVQSGLQFATSGPDPGGALTTAAALAEEVMKSMLSVKLKTAVIALVIVAAGGVGLAQRPGSTGSGADAIEVAAAGRLLVLDAPTGVDAGTPTTEEIWNKFVETRFPSRKVVIEKIGDRADACKLYPLVGPCQLVHRHFKCTLYYEERRGNDLEHGAQVVYIDKDHLRRCTEPSHGHTTSGEALPVGGAADAPRESAVSDAATGPTVAGPASGRAPMPAPSDSTTTGSALGIRLLTRENASRTGITAETSPSPSPGRVRGIAIVSDQERRLAEVERKLDRVLRLLEPKAEKP